MKKSEFKQIIKEEIHKVLNEININPPGKDPEERKLENFIDINFTEFSRLGSSEIIPYDSTDFATSTILYLKKLPNQRFDYNGICVYYVLDNDEVWVENMDAKEDDDDFDMN